MQFSSPAGLNGRLRPKSLALTAVVALLLVAVAPIAWSQPDQAAPAAAGRTAGPMAAAQLDADPAEVTVSATDAVATEAGPTTGTFTISRTGPTTSALTVNYSLGGTATDTTDFAHLSGSVVIAAGSDTAAVVVTPVDDSDPEGDEDVVLTLAASADYTEGEPASATVVIEDDDPPVVTVEATDATAAETGPNNGEFTISRTGPTTSALTVNYSLGGTATDTADYAHLTGSVIIPAGSANVKLAVIPVNDANHELSETVVLSIATSATYAIGTAASATVTIEDNDPAVVTVTASDSSAAESGPNTGTFTFTRTGTTAGTLTVVYTIGGTATNGTDYAAISNSVAFAAGRATADVTIIPINDAVSEAAETVVATIVTSAGYTPGSPSSATVTIADNDDQVVSIKATDDKATEFGPTTGTFTVTRTGNVTAALTVTYTIGGTATNGSDYSSLTGSVTIAAGQFSATIKITPINDALDEGDELVTLTLSPDARYTLGSPASDSVRIEDDDDKDDVGKRAVVIVPGLTDRNQCKKGGWIGFGVFKNQGDCVSYVATGFRNPPDGG